MEKNNSFYKLNFESLSLEKIDSKIVKLIAPSFFDFCYICNLYYRRYKTIIIDSDKESCSFFKNRKLMGFYQHTNKILILSNHRFTLSEKVYYYKNSLIFFDLPSKSIIFKKNKLFLNSEKSYMCLDVNLLTNGTIISIEKNNSNHEDCLIKTYDIEELNGK